MTLRFPAMFRGIDRDIPDRKLTANPKIVNSIKKTLKTVYRGGHGQYLMTPEKTVVAGPSIFAPSFK